MAVARVTTWSSGQTLTATALNAEFDNFLTPINAVLPGNYGTGDLLYASSATQWSALAAGTQNFVLQMGASIPAWFNLFGTANTFTANQTISNSAPSLILTDTTGSAKSLTIAVDANLAQFRESAGAAGSLMVLDLANNRMILGSNTPTASTILELASTTGSLLIPRMTTAQKNALTPAAGMLVYDTSLAAFHGYTSSWGAFGGGGSGGKQHLWIPASAMTPRITNGPSRGITEQTTNKNAHESVDFDRTTQEFVQFALGMPKSWDEGTVTFIPYWTAASGAGGVVFGLAGVATSDDDALDVAFGTAQTSTDTLILANDCHAGPESSAVTIAGTPATNDFVTFQINRTVADGSDTLTADAKLLGILLILTTNADTDA